MGPGISDPAPELATAVKTPGFDKEITRNSFYSRNDCVFGEHASMISYMYTVNMPSGHGVKIFYVHAGALNLVNPSVSTRHKLRFPYEYHPTMQLCRQSRAGTYWIC